MHALKKWNVDDLTAKINDLFGWNLIWKAETAKNYAGEKYLCIESEDILPYGGLLANTLKAAHLATFNASEINDDTGYCYWTSIVCAATFLSGGTNSWHYINAWQRTDGTWLVKLDKQGQN